MFVSRKEELEKIAKTWERAKKEGRLLIMVGPLGSGKNTLLKEFSKITGANILYYRCEEDEEYIPLGTLRRFGLVYFPQLLKRRAEMYTTFSKILSKLQEKTPLIMHFRYINYSDSLSLKFLQYFALKKPKGILLVISYPVKGERRELNEILEKLIMEDYADILIVSNLTEKGVEEYTERQKIKAVTDEIYKVTEGNLSFLELWVKCFKENKIEIKDVNEGFKCVYSALTDRERDLLSIGATMGNLFWITAIEDIMGDVSKELEELEKLQIIHKFSNIYGTQIYQGYVFIQPDFRKYVYSIIDENKRKRYHKVVAKLIEQRKIHVGWERTYELAKHYVMADAPESIPYLKNCIRTSIKEHDYASALHHLDFIERYLNSYNENAARVEMYYHFIKSFQKLGDKDNSMKYINKLENFSILQKAWTYRTTGEFNESINLCKRIRQNAKDEYIQMRTYGIEADCKRRLGLYKQALNIQMKHVKMAEKLKNYYEIATGYKNIGNIKMDMMKYEEAKTYYKKSLDIFKDIKNMRGISAIYNNMGIFYSDTMRKEKALNYYKKSLNIDEQINDYEGMATAYNNIGTIYEALGDFYNALDAYRKSVKYNIIAGNNDGLNYAYGNMASLLMEAGKFRDAMEYVDKELKIAEKNGSVRFIISGNITKARLYQFIGKYAESVTFAKNAIKVGNNYKDYYNPIDAYYYLAKSYYYMGKEEECINYAEKALEMYKNIGIEDRSSHIYSLMSRYKGKEILKEMEKVIKIYSPEDEYEIWMAKIITYAKEGKEHWAYLEKVIESLKKLNRLATLVDFLEEYYKITGYENIKEEIDRIKKNFVYPDSI